MYRQLYICCNQHDLAHGLAKHFGEALQDDPNLTLLHTMQATTRTTSLCAYGFAEAEHI